MKLKICLLCKRVNILEFKFHLLLFIYFAINISQGYFSTSFPQNCKMLLPSHIITNTHCIKLEGWPDFQDMTPAGLSQAPMGGGEGGGGTEKY